MHSCMVSIFNCVILFQYSILFIDLCPECPTQISFCIGILTHYYQLPQVALARVISKVLTMHSTKNYNIPAPITHPSAKRVPATCHGAVPRRPFAAQFRIVFIFLFVIWFKSHISESHLLSNSDLNHYGGLERSDCATWLSQVWECQKFTWKFLSPWKIVWLFLFFVLPVLSIPRYVEFKILDFFRPQKFWMCLENCSSQFQTFQTAKTFEV